MVLNALDEVLFWNDIEELINFTKQNISSDKEIYYQKKEHFLNTVIPNKDSFLMRLNQYTEAGKPTWISGKNRFIDEINTDTVKKAILISSKKTNGEKKAIQASKWLDNNPTFWKFYVDHIFHNSNNMILELTIGAGGGTNAVMKNMNTNDFYMGVDIDFICAKNADALAKYYNVNGLGITAPLWNLPFENEMFTSVCSNAGLEECREIPTILKESYRVLAPCGLLVLRCLLPEKSQCRSYFEKYGFGYEDMLTELNKVRMYANSDQVIEICSSIGFKFHTIKKDSIMGDIIVLEK